MRVVLEILGTLAQMGRREHTMKRVTTSNGFKVTGYTQEDVKVWTTWAHKVRLWYEEFPDSCSTEEEKQNVIDCMESIGWSQQDMIDDAQRIIDRIASGNIIDIDICGLQDWAENNGWDETKTVVWADKF